MNNYIIDVGTKVLIDALSKFGTVYKVKPGKIFSFNNVGNYYEVIFRSEDFKNPQIIIEFFKQKKINLTAILSFNEDTRSFWYDIAKVINVHTNIKHAYVENQNKIIARHKINMALPNTVTYTTVEEFLKTDSHQFFPIIVKPIYGKGSMYVKKCDSLEELLLYLQGKEITNYYIEEFIDGKEISVEAYHLKGKHFIYGVTTKLKYPGTVVEAGHISNIVKLTDEQNNDLYKIYNSLEYTETVSHTEMIITKQGLFYVESHPRLGGDLVPTLTLPEFQNNFYEEVMKISLGDTEEIKRITQHTKRLSLFPYPTSLPATFTYKKGVIEHLQKQFNAYLVIPLFKNGCTLTHMPESSYERPLSLAIEVGSESDISKKISEIVRFCNSNFFE